MKGKKKNTGSTMVEVIVGFAILMIIIASLTGVIHLSSEMVFSARDSVREQGQFAEEFYKKEHGLLVQEKLSSGQVTLRETNADGNTKTGGTAFVLDQAEPSRVSDQTSGINVYQIDKPTGEDG
jgi:hypothetical protein